MACIWNDGRIEKGFVMEVSLSQLQMILTIAECGSVTRAAEILNRPQPSVSRTLKEVEDQIGAQIFNRSTRSFSLTDHGQVVIRHARSIVAEMRHAKDELAILNERLLNRVRIGVHSIASASIVVPAVARFKEIVPEAHLEIDEDQTQKMLPPLRHGEYDFLVATLPDEAVEGLTFEPLLASRLGIFVRKQHPLAEAKEYAFADLVRFPWIYPLPHALRAKEMENLFSLNSVRKPEVGVATMSPELSRHALLNNDWVIMTQGDLLLDEIRHQRVVELKPSDALRDVTLAIVQREASEPSETAGKLIDVIRREADSYNKKKLNWPKSA